MQKVLKKMDKVYHTPSLKRKRGYMYPPPQHMYPLAQHITHTHRLYSRRTRETVRRSPRRFRGAKRRRRRRGGGRRRKLCPKQKR
jgi:hypothetical protein